MPKLLGWRGPQHSISIETNYIFLQLVDTQSYIIHYEFKS